MVTVRTEHFSVLCGVLWCLCSYSFFLLLLDFLVVYLYSSGHFTHGSMYFTSFNEKNDMIKGALWNFCALLEDGS